MKFMNIFMPLINLNIVKIKLPSKLFIYLNNNVTANIGRNDNINHNLTNFGKAGAKR